MSVGKKFPKPIDILPNWEYITAHGQAIKQVHRPGGTWDPDRTIIMYYAAVNSYATETSVGFSNTWGVLGFATKAMRDAYVRRATDLATRAISSKEIRKYDERHGHVNYYDATGRLHIHMRDGEFADGSEVIDPVTAKLIDGWMFA